jgi:predicted hotdog family 3-hydroxylacyl-ACP dehydratase
MTWADILKLIPHQGEMCLLDDILEWDSGKIRCLSHRYAGVQNPLRRADGTLGTATAIEISAQAMAAHGRLTAPAAGDPVPGYLVSLRDVHFYAAKLAGSGPLTITAALLLGDAGSASYHFAVIDAAGADILSGRATVLFGAMP